ncbi:MAG: ATP-binding protein, partial [Proteobacteria bacterium]|nr:ATP-binding protein [Pseudomonadota bacterium]
PRVVDGLIDLTDWDFVGQGSIELSGQYEFYWQQQLSAHDFQRMDTQSGYKIAVPSEWNGTIINDEQIGGDGFATYRVNVLTSQRSPLALKLPDFGTAVNVIVDGKTVFQAGHAGKDAASTVPKYHPAVVAFTPTSNRVEIIFQVSNFDHRLGGAWLPILLGTPEQLVSLRENQLARDLVLFGAILIIGLYNIALYALRTENKSSLFLGLFCLLLSSRQLMVGDRFMTRIFPDLPFEWYVRIEYLGWYLAATTFVAFIHSLFPREFHRYISRGIHGVFGLGALIVLLTPTQIFTYTAPVYQVLTIAALIYGGSGLLVACLRKRDGAYILLFAYAVLFYTIVSDILANAGLTSSILLLDVGLFVFILCQSVLISYRFTQSFKTIEVQRGQLQSANLKLRTQEKLRRDAEVESEALHERIIQSEKMEAIGLLAGGVAHDLNNILSTTVTYPELALLDLPKDSPLARPLEMTKQAGLRAAAVIQDMLTLARRGVVQRDVVNLNDIINEFRESVEHELMQTASPKVKVEMHLSSDLDNIEGSSVHLQKLLMNLISNGIEAQTDGGKVYVTTHNERTASRELFYQTIKAGNYVVLSIEDEGTGIDPDDLDKVFEPFYTTKVMGQSGTGLGMSVVWGVIFDHEGAIDVMSEQDIGTRFDIYIPRTLKEAPPKPVKEPIDNLLGKQQRILVVDDLADQRQLTEDVLVRLNYQVSTCATGQAAVDLLAEQDFSLVILDMVIDDGWDGLTTFQEIIKIAPNIKTILVSGFAETEQVVEAQAQGAGTFLRKPFTIEGLGRRLKSELTD